MAAPSNHPDPDYRPPPPAGGGGGAIEATSTSNDPTVPLLHRPPTSNPNNANNATATVSTRTRKLLRRKASLSENERFFLRALLVDDVSTPDESSEQQQQQQQSRDASAHGDEEGSSAGGGGGSERSFDGDMLTSIPAELVVEVPIEEEEEDEDDDDLEEGGKTSNGCEGGATNAQFDSLPGRPNKEGQEDEDHEAGPSESEQEQQHRPPLLPPTHRRDTSLHVGLWRAHEDGVSPSALRRYSGSGPGPLAGMIIGGSSRDVTGTRRQSRRSSRRRSSARSSIVSPSSSAAAVGEDGAEGVDDEGDDDCSIASDESVGRERRNDRDEDDDRSDSSSWGVDEGGFDHYDAWQLLKDEYAPDFGYSYADTNVVAASGSAAAAGADNDENDDDEKPHRAAHASPILIGGGEGVDDYGVGYFRILGTSADDVDSQPHVLSPPLMESLLNFVPEHLCCENLWLKYSLVRDGASIMTLRELCRDSRYTILALETTDGDVLGSFTSSPWRKTFRYFGTGEAFLWKMRHSRNEPCHSIFEQAQLESEIDVFPFSGLNYYVQLCTNEKLAIGGGRLVPSGGVVGHGVGGEEKKDGDVRLASSYPTELAPIRSGDEMDDETDAAGVGAMTMDVGGGFRYTPYGGGDGGGNNDVVELEDQEGGSQDAGGNNTNAFGFGLAINRDLLYGTSSPCATFRNPSLSTHSSGEDAFEIVNLEVWTFTPCRTVESAMELEEKKSVRSDSVSSSLNEFGGAASSLSRSAGGVSSYLREDYRGGIRPGGGGGGGGMGISSFKSAPLYLH